MDTLVRILDVEIYNFKNVAHGKISFPSAKKLDTNKADVLGVYGQNGSGKTAIVEAFMVLKDILTGKSISNELSHLIYFGKNATTLKFSFLIKNKESQYYCDYEVEIEKNENNNIYISKEILRYKKMIAKNKIRTAISYRAQSQSSSSFLEPKSLTNSLKSSSEQMIDLIVQKKLSMQTRTSFIFNSEVMNILEGYFPEDVTFIMSSLSKRFAVNLFVIPNQNIGYIYANILLPLSFQLENTSKTKGASGQLGIPTDYTQDLGSPILISKQTFEYARKIFEQINSVLPKIIPGLTVQLNSLGTQTLGDGTEGVKVELLSYREGRKLPFSCESDGVKKLTSMLSTLVAMFNNPNVCVVIDELDAGVYEFLLGEIIEILDDYGKGQLLFTSHNLRLLEVLDSESLIFTTTNPNERFIKLKGIKQSNNIRDVYIRAVQLGGQPEEIYEETDSFEIRKAFEKAGKIEIRVSTYS